MKTILLLHCTYHTFAALLSNCYYLACQATSPESLSTCFTKTGKNLSSSSLLPSVANPYWRIKNRSSCRLLVIYFATASVSICITFEWPNQYLFTILESGNMFLNSLAAWSAILKRRLCSTREPEKGSSAFITFWSKFAVAELASKLLNFLCCCLASTYPLCFEAYLCLLLSFSPLWATLKSLPHTVHKAKPSPFRDFWIYLNLLHHESLSFTQDFRFFDGAGSKLSTIFFAIFWLFFTVPSLLGNNRKIDL